MTCIAAPPCFGQRYTHIGHAQNTCRRSSGSPCGRRVERIDRPRQLFEIEAFQRGIGQAAGVGLDDLSFAEVHDCFTTAELLIYEAMGLTGKMLTGMVDKLGIPLHERARLAGVAVDAVFDSVSVATTFKEKLNDAGVIFCPFSEAVIEHPELVKKYLRQKSKWV